MQKLFLFRFIFKLPWEMNCGWTKSGGNWNVICDSYENLSFSMAVLRCAVVKKKKAGKEGKSIMKNGNFNPSFRFGVKTFFTSKFAWTNTNFSRGNSHTKSSLNLHKIFGGKCRFGGKTDSPHDCNVLLILM